MKLSLIFVLPILFLISCHSERAKNSEIQELPEFKMLLTDSVSLFEAKNLASGKPTILLFFKPDCSHCRKETKEILEHLQSLKDAQILMLSNAEIPDIRIFSMHFKLDQYKNFTIGRDYERSFYKIFHPSSVPFMAIYDRQKKLLKIYSDDVDIESVISAIQI